MLRLTFCVCRMLRLTFCVCHVHVDVCLYVCVFVLHVFLNACPYLVAKAKGGQLVPMQRERTNGGNCQYFHFPIEMGLAV